MAKQLLRSHLRQVIEPQVQSIGLAWRSDALQTLDGMSVEQLQAAGEDPEELIKKLTEAVGAAGAAVLDAGGREGRGMPQAQVRKVVRYVPQVLVQEVVAKLVGGLLQTTIFWLSATPMQPRCWQSWLETRPTSMPAPLWRGHAHEVKTDGGQGTLGWYRWVPPCLPLCTWPHRIS